MVALAMGTVSCSDNNNGGRSTAPITTGTLSSGTDADSRLPEGYRITGVGDMYATYDSNGRLTSFTMDEGIMEIKNGVLAYSYSGNGFTEKFSINLNGMNLIESITYSYEERYGKEYEKESGKMTFSYNNNLQLTSMDATSNYEEYEDGEREKGSYKYSATANYNGTILESVSSHGIEKDEYDVWEDIETKTLSYNSNYPNLFYQFTPSLADCLLDLDDDGPIILAYLGLFGRASSKLPTSYLHKEIEKEDGETYNDSHTHNCGPYTYNSYGALTSADGVTYRYTTISRSVANAPVLKERTKPLFKLHRANKRSNR